MLSLYGTTGLDVRSAMWFFADEDDRAARSGRDSPGKLPFARSEIYRRFDQIDIFTRQFQDKKSRTVDIVPNIRVHHAARHRACQQFPDVSNITYLKAGEGFMYDCVVNKLSTKRLTPQAHKRYEFGWKVSVSVTSRGGWFVGAIA